MVQIAYRTKYCGWTLDQAADEIDRTVGLVKVSHGPDYRHMVSFYENRVLPLRRRTSRASTARSRQCHAVAGPMARAAMLMPRSRSDRLILGRRLALRISDSARR